MAKGSIKSVFKDHIVPVSGGASDLELNGGAKTLQGEFEIGGQKPVIIVGEGGLYAVLDELKR